MAVFPGVVPSIGNDLITGSGGIDFLTGFYGNDTIRGGAGNDIIVEAIFTWPSGGFTLTDGFQVRGGLTYDFGRGNDSIDGGAGLDLLTYDDRRVGIVVDLALGRVTTGAEVDRFIGIEAVELGNGADLVYANKAGFVVDLSAGNDRVIGMAGQSLYIGGDGNDTLDLSGSLFAVRAVLQTSNVQFGTASALVREFEFLIGSAVAANIIYGGVEDNRFWGGRLDDDLRGGYGVNTLYGGAGNDRLIGGDSMDSLYGGSGNDIIVGGDYRDTLDGSIGDDQIFGGGYDDILYGGVGNDYIVASFANESSRSSFGNDEAYGGDGNDRLVSMGSGFARIYGGAGNDFISVNKNDSVYGGDGDDRIIGSNFLFAEYFGGSGNDSLTLNGFGWVTLETGLNGFESIIFATDEYQVVTMLISNYRLNLGAGDDQVTLKGASNYNTINLGAGLNTVNVISGHHNTIFGGAGEDRIGFLGTTGAGSVIVSGAGNDLIGSHAGFVTISTGLGDDTVAVDSPGGTVVNTGGGADEIDVGSFSGKIDMGSGNDILMFLNSERLDLQVWTGLGADHIHFVLNGPLIQVDFMDFDPLLDHITGLGSNPLSLATSIKEDATGVNVALQFYFGGLPRPVELRFEGMTQADLNSSMFSL